MLPRQRGALGGARSGTMGRHRAALRIARSAEGIRGYEQIRLRREGRIRQEVEAALTHARQDDVVLLVSRGDGAEERRFVRDWFLADLEAEALQPPVSEE